MRESSSTINQGNQPLLVCKDLSLGYPVKHGWKPVVKDVSFEICKGQIAALVGESGSGKSTIAKALVKLIPVKGGTVELFGQDVTNLDNLAFKPFRKRMQLVFQDPWQALNPRLSARQLLMEPLELHFPGFGRLDKNKRILQLLDSVHLPHSMQNRYPGELSGGQRQRLLLARAMAVEPEFLICDEPVSALDVSIQAQLLQLLRELKTGRNLTILFISHDLAVVQQMADQILVMQDGKAVEWRSSAELFRNPQHEYTRMLIEACPKW